MSVKYEKWRDLSVEPFSINYKKIKLLEIISYPPAQNDVIECKCELNKDVKNLFIKIERSKMADFNTENKHLDILIKKDYYKKIPKIIEYGEIQNKNYTILEKIEGERLSDILNKTKKEKKDYLIKYGKELAVVHKISNNSFNTAKQRIINDVPSEENYKVLDDFVKPECVKISV